MPSGCKQLTVFAPAKVNLHLAVGERGADGFHSVESVFVKTDFGDTLHFLPVNGNTVKLEMKFTEDASFTDSPPAVIPREKNIIYKAMTLFRSRTGFERGLIIRAEKRIPAGSGLGGGSSDAAGALLALNKIAGFPLLPGALLEMAAALGSDVPFFMQGAGAAWVTGRGEHVKPLQIPRLFLTLAAPGFPSDTASAYRQLDNYRLTRASGADAPPEASPAQAKPVIEQNRLDFASMRNDFLPVFSESEKAAYNSIIDGLMELGADYASLSGSGSACFGVFGEKALADNAAARLAKEWKFVKSCATL